MEEVEKMTALKKVYADIILNMAKDSAARVLASERRALSLQHGLSAAKEEALATLLRLKSIMDSKIREAEMASMGQVRRIQELEDQLNEAEDIICSLRTELKRVNNEMYKMKKNTAEPLNGQDTNGHITSSLDECHKSKPSSDPVQCSSDGSGHLLTFDTKKRTLGERNAEGFRCPVENATQSEPLKDFSAASNPDLASIIMRSKEPELYRNRCTQRIRAFEQNLLTAKVTRGKSDDQLSNLKSELIDCEITKSRRPCTTDSAMADEAILQVKNPTESKDILQPTSSCGDGQECHMRKTKRKTKKKFCHTVSSRKQGGKRNDINSSNCRIFSDQDVADNEPSDIVNRKRSEDGKICPDISIKNGSSGLLRCSKRTVTMQSIMMRSHSDSENQILQSLPFSTENIGYVNDALVTEPFQNDEGNKLQMEVSTLSAPDHEATDNSLTLLCKANPETGDVSMANSDEKDGKTCESGGTAQAGSRFLKYTFQRKRKRGSSNSSNENALLEKKSTSKRAGDKVNAFLEPQKPSLAVELPRKDRRLVQVARQLISLSERRW